VLAISFMEIDRLNITLLKNPDCKEQEDMTVGHLPRVFWTEPNCLVETVDWTLGGVPKSCCRSCAHVLFY